jgi:hypothetical protein
MHVRANLPVPATDRLPVSRPGEAADPAALLEGSRRPGLGVARGRAALGAAAGGHPAALLHRGDCIRLNLATGMRHDRTS